MPMKPASKTQKQLLAENEELRARLDEAEETLRAIRSGEVDALIVTGAGGEQVYALKGADYSYRLLVEEMNEGALTLTAEGTILFSNRCFAKMIKAPPEKVIGSAIITWLAPGSQTRVHALLGKGGPDKFNVEAVLTASDGTQVPVNLAGSRLNMADMPDYVGLVATDLTDVTQRKEKEGKILLARAKLEGQLMEATESRYELLSVIEDQKQAEDQIRQMNEELETRVQERTRQLLDAQEELVRKEKLSVLGQVAGSVGHELRNPLGVMSNAVYFLQTVLPEADETVREYLGIIKNEIAASERIVSDLLDSVRTRPPHPQTVGIAELVAQALRKASVPASISVTLDLPATLPPLRVDAQQIHQVLRNLISNGVEAMSEGGTLEIRATENQPDGTVTVSVRDSGSGIAPEVLAKLFTPLLTTKARGIGLGLVVVKNLTQANGGTVTVESEVGKGTVFTITVPAAVAGRAVGMNPDLQENLSGFSPSCLTCRDESRPTG